MEKTSRLIVAVNAVFVLAKVSAYFWWGLIKRGFVYGWYGSLATCLTLYASPQAQYLGLKEVDYHSKEGKAVEFAISMMMTFSFLLALVSWFGMLLNYSDSLLLGFLVGSLSWLLLMAWLPFFQEVVGRDVKISLAASFRLMLGRLNDVTVLFTVLVLLDFLALTQHLLVWFFLPGIYCLVFTKLKQLRKGQER